ncbi:chromosome segregation protein SMC [Cucumibacter marinus]|uniref:chromosome segregation protein SMC n=1 Tax=Cucumibacter marinus TaxID=1121252 RepID=UPI0003FA745F|nr:chromosome segregation protein SMC [Cucumibacter marinus]
MKFTRLKIVGFKSFVDPTELHIETGLTGIVGPNGCGKSNLVEALRWVMGESSYKNMRASGMDDVIFSGSGNRPARNSAEVTCVLDNTDRTAPNAFNNADTLEVTRRIEREAGSIYRLNAKDVRARDVQLLFADASTGARSPALVRQGQIGELIAAKPVQRRALLEEAAGISGLHSRRHEAELRLRAAEQNLERVDDIIAQVETQLDTLKRQARQAVRYRAISGDIRRAEAGLYHLRWVAARHAEKQAEAEQAQMVKTLADAHHADQAAKKQLETSLEALAPLRKAEAEAAAALQRLKIEREHLTNEARQADSRRRELEARLTQIRADAERDDKLIAEAATSVERLTEEREGLEEAARDEAGATERAREEAEVARGRFEEAQAALMALNDQMAQLKARRSQIERNLADAEQRVTRLEAQRRDVADEAAAIAKELSENKTLSDRRAALASAQQAAEAAEQAALEAEAGAAKAAEAFEAERPKLGEIEQALGRLEAEAATIAKLLNVQDSALWPPIVDAIKVASGYETALGAVFGDDLDASTDTGAPLYWQAPGAMDDPQLPAGAEPLSAHVSGAPVLKRRLDQIGIVDGSAGKALQALLKPGQVLVTLDGDVWRWDGFTARGDAPTAAAQRLSQRNRLAEIDREMNETRAAATAQAEKVQALSAERDTRRQAESEARANWRQAQHTISAAQAALDEAQQDLSELNSRRSALEEARVRLESSLEEARGLHQEAVDAKAGLEDETALGQKIATSQIALDEARETADRARLTLGGFDNAAKMRAQRLEQIARDAASWDGRLRDARSHLETLSNRQQDIESQLEQLASAPDAFAERADKLDGQIIDAEHLRKRAADKLAEAETEQRSEDMAARQAGEALSGAREAMARIEERLKSHIVQRQQVEKQIEENLEISPRQTAEVAGFKPEAQLPDEGQLEARLERLKRERERLGGVNLRAEREAEEVGEKLETMVNDREDLIAAIAKLRHGIQSLNREGRARLTEAFDRVNGHFKALFTRLFGGGTAELTFVESDDPLEAGLEIIARPPGKKPQTMTLLSGGEQALTAMSLIFAVFLTNPAPICVLDEVDAPLDDANVERFCDLLDSMREQTETRFMVITHNPITMARMDRLFGVTMAEKGVSQLVSVDLTTAESFREAS